MTFDDKDSKSRCTYKMKNFLKTNRYRLHCKNISPEIHTIQLDVWSLNTSDDLITILFVFFVISCQRVVFSFVSVDRESRHFLEKHFYSIHDSIIFMSTFDSSSKRDRKKRCRVRPIIKKTITTIGTNMTSSPRTQIKRRMKSYRQIEDDELWKF